MFSFHQAVPNPQRTANFFQQVLGFRRLRRPPSFDVFDGAWLCGLGMEIHLIQQRTNRAAPSLGDNLDPRADHISFLTPDIDIVSCELKKRQVKYAQSEFQADGIRQLFFREPSSAILIEVSDNPMC